MSATVAHLAARCAVSVHGGNVVTLYLSAVSESFDIYSVGWCGPLTHRASQWLKGNQIAHQRLMITRAVEEGNELYPAAKNQPSAVWYHAIIAMNGVVHCPWLNERLGVEEYCARMFPGQRVTVEEDYNCCTTMMWDDSEAKAA